MISTGESGEKGHLASQTDQVRIDALEKVTGQAKYIEDLPALPRMAFGAALRSPYSHARIVSVDSSRAERLPGVLGVIDREHIADLNLRFEKNSFSHEFITPDKARFDGDLLGVVAAIDHRTAKRAVELIHVEYDLLPPLFSAAEALAPGAALIHEELGTNLAIEDSLEWGDVELGLKESDYVFEETFVSPAVYHHPMEPAVSSLVDFTGDTLHIWVSTNHPVAVGEMAARLFGLKPDKVRVRVPYVGGSFGAKDHPSDMLVGAALSRKIGRPIKLIASAEESFRVTARHAMVYKAKVGVKADGTLVALDVDLQIDTGAYFTGAAIATNNAITSASGGYRVPNFRARGRTAYTNKVPAGPFRNSGKNQTTFGVDCTMDNVARKIGMDPIEFRLKNLLRRGEYVAPKTWKKGGKESEALTPPVDTDLPELIQRAMNAIGWDRRSSPRSPVKSESRFAQGRGIAISMRRGSQVGIAEAMVALERSGTVSVFHNAPDVGEGAHTVISIVAARTLEIPQSQIRVGQPDTANKLNFSGTSSQRTTVQMGGAVQAACKDLLGKLVEAAVRVKGGSAEEWRIAEGRLCRGEATLSFAEIAQALEPSVVLQGLGSYKRTRAGHTSFGGHDHWAPGVAAAEVEVDRETGEVRVLRYSAVADAGKALHYNSAKGQIEGGAAMGLGISMFEELVYQEGQLQNADPFQYRLCQMGDIPQSFRAMLVENEDGPGPFGSKAIAQVSIPCPAPAIGNAICDALGVRIRSTPFSPEKILHALGKLGSEK